MDLTTATPAEIDTALAEIWSRYYVAAITAEMADSRLTRHRVGMNRADAGEFGYSRSTYSDAEEARLDAAREAAEEAARVIMRETRPFDAEFSRRGGWTRAYLVKNNGGHVHSTMMCKTCFPTTQFGWLTQMSDHSEAEIVELAGMSACSVCYPSAPRIGRNQLELPADVAAREARQSEKAARAAAKAEKAIKNPDGTPLRGRWGVIETKVSAWRELVGNLADVELYGYGPRDADNARIIAAIAADYGVSVASVQDMAISKAAAKVKRDRANR